MPINLEPILKTAEPIYGKAHAEIMCRKLAEMIAKYQFPPQLIAYSERDAILITYGDMVTHPNEDPLFTLRRFLNHHAKKAINTVHILPFFPYSSDEGFSVIDYKTVNPRLGSWDDIHALSVDFSLMMDLVANHSSVEHQWFKGFLAGRKAYENYYISISPDSDTRSVFRPRTSPLLTPFETKAGEKYVWTTFSADQADLNYQEPQVLLEMLDTLLLYASQSARYIRLDAIAYIWKELGTSSIHLPQVHAIIQMMRMLLNAVSPGVKLITETNVPHKDNISYFGNGMNEAQLVYNFSLPPLTLHAFHTGDSEIFSRWAATLEAPSESTTFFNFLASHDGIGITPAHGLLPQNEITRMAERVEASGGYVSYKTNADGSQSAYEFNINYFDALDDPQESGIPVKLKVRRFITAHAIMAALQGVPGIYFHSLFGSTSWFDGARKSGTPRTINRQRLLLERVEAELANENSLRHQIYTGLKDLLLARRLHPAFHPNASQSVPWVNPSVITILRHARGTGRKAICLHNIRAEKTQVNLGEISGLAEISDPVRVIYHNNPANSVLDGQTITLSAYESVWLEV